MPDTHDLGRLFTHSVQLDPEAPAVHTAVTAEYDDPCRFSRSAVIRTRFRRRGRWHGIRRSWLSVQIKLPTGERITDAVWGIVVGWWRYPAIDEEWDALARATRLGKDPDGTSYTAPTGASQDQSLIDVDRRRVDATGHPGADG